MQAWIATTDVVQWDRPFASSYKLHPGDRRRDEFGQAQTTDTDDFAIQLLDDNAGNTNTLAVLDRLKLSPVERDFRVLRFRNIVARFAPDSLTEISAQPDVISWHRIKFLSPKVSDALRHGRLLTRKVRTDDFPRLPFCCCLPQKICCKKQS